jgi:hypothetical protein
VQEFKVLLDLHKELKVPMAQELKVLLVLD